MHNRYIKKVYFFVIILILIISIFFVCNSNNPVSVLRSTIGKVFVDSNDSLRLSSLEIEGLEDEYTFDPDTVNYNINIYDNLYYLNINAIPENSSANVEILNNNLLTSSNGTITINVKLNDDTNSYYINWTKGKSINKYYKIQDIDYTGGEYVFTAPESGDYKLETWGAQGGNSRWNSSVMYQGGYGAYSTGTYHLESGNKIYINVGGVGVSSCSSYCTGGYNGGGTANGAINGDQYIYDCFAGAGGGATHIATQTGVLSSLSSSKSSVIIVAGGGGGSSIHRYGDSTDWWKGYGGHGGGYQSVAGVIPKTGRSPAPSLATQTSASTGYDDKTSNPIGSGSFGSGLVKVNYCSPGGGGGWYGGAGSVYTSSTGGSGYIGNSNLTNKYMYCYNCSTTTAESTYTKSNVTSSCHSSEAKEDCTKEGNGFARISIKGIQSNYNYLDTLSIPNGTLDKTFDPTVYEYNVTVTETTHTLVINSTTSHGAVITGNGNRDIKYDGDSIALTVEAKDGSSRVYTFNIIRTKSGKASNKIYSVRDTYTNQTIYFDNTNTVSGFNVYDEELYADLEVTLYDSEATYITVGANPLLRDGVIKIYVSREGLETNEYTINYNSSSMGTGEYSYTGNYQVFESFNSMDYKIELWGSEGSGKNPGKGAYTSGVVFLEKGTKLYVYVGEQNESYNKNTFNGSLATDNANYHSGGGATDVRLVKGDWNNFDSLKSRIMVAGGGGGIGSGREGDYQKYPGGAAGGLTGYSAISAYGDGEPASTTTGGSQTSGGVPGTWNLSGKYGSFGTGANGNGMGGDHRIGGGGGGGYYGGGAGPTCGGDCGFSGSGGSSFISGHTGSNAINESSTSSSISHTGKANHYSGYVFSDTKMIDGEGYEWTSSKTSIRSGVPLTDGSGVENGHTGEGFARITAVNNNNYLKSITTTAGEIDGIFNPSNDTININVDMLTMSLELTATPINESSTVDGDGQVTIDLDTLVTTRIITVTSESGSVRTYTVNINRTGHSNEIYSIFDKTNGNEIIVDRNTDTYNITLYKSNGSAEFDIKLFDPAASYTIEGNVGLVKSSSIVIKVNVENTRSIKTYTINYTLTEADELNTYEFTGDYETFTAQYRGRYKIELWGAAGTDRLADYGNHEGYGAYTAGFIDLAAGTNLYVYVGEHGENYSVSRPYGQLSFNGASGGNYTCYTYHKGTNAYNYYGGSATDIRVTPGNWDNSASLASRIMVAAGGSSASYYGHGEGGGGLTGYSGHSGTGGTQTGGGTSNGSFGKAGVPQKDTDCASSESYGAGSGYYGGGATYGSSRNTSARQGSAGSGSSFISGHTGCVAIKAENNITPKDGCSNGTTDIECSKHYSGYVFEETTMIDGEGYKWSYVKLDDKVEMPKTDGTGLEAHHSGDGYARIKYISTNNYLKSLTSDVGTFVQDFDPTLQEYDLKVDLYTHSLTINGVAADEKNATVVGFKKYDVPYNPSQITITVTSEYGEERTYTINVIRNALFGHSSKLFSIYNSTNDETINCEREIYNYSVTVFTHQLYLDFEVTPFDEDATYEIIDNYFINDTGNITIRVSAPDVSDTDYILHYEKISISNRVEPFDYTGDVQTFTAPYSGYYKLEAWGAQGGGEYFENEYVNGGYGSYSVGEIKLEKGDVLYIYVGGQGELITTQTQDSKGGFNGGGNAYHWKNNDCINGGGGGATHISTVPGLLSELSSYKDTAGTNKSNEILIVAGGGGGYGGEPKSSSSSNKNLGGNAGGYLANNGMCISRDGYGSGGSQTSGGAFNVAFTDRGYAEAGSFGKGGNSSLTSDKNNNGGGSAGGAGWYGGGGGSAGGSGAGGSGYIGSPMITNKHMTCYSCSTSDSEDTKTISNQNVSASPQSDYSKLGNGYVKITGKVLPSNNNFLSSLNSDKGYFNEDFDPTLSDYTLYVDLYDHEVTLSGNLSDSNFATVDGLGEIELDVKPEPVVITVTAENGAIRTYTVNIVRKMEGGHSTKLFSIINGSNQQTIYCEKDKYNYDGLVVYYSQIELIIDAVPFDDEATFVVDGNGLIIEDGEITITVSAPGVEDTVYKVAYTREEDNIPPVEFSYKNYDQTYQIKTTGFYKLEVWGAAGGWMSSDVSYGNNRGYGGYSYGVYLGKSGTTLHINTGGTGVCGTSGSGVLAGGYNGGGYSISGSSSGNACCSGGGATHIALEAGELYTFNEKRDQVLIVAGGGGGIGPDDDRGGAGGGTLSGNGTGTASCNGHGATQDGLRNDSNCTVNAPVCFGRGVSTSLRGGGGGGGWYGGDTGSSDRTDSYNKTVQSCTPTTSFNTYGYNEWSGGGGGGSGYLKDTLTDKGFYCYYGCGGELTTETGNKGEHIVNYANTGAGYARITYNTISFNNYLKSLTSDTGTWENEFKPTRTSYQVNVDMYTQSITFDGETSDIKASVIGLGEYELEIGYNYVTIYVTAESGDIREYDIVVLRENLKGGHTAELMKISNPKNEQVIRCTYKQYAYDLEVYSYQTHVDLDITPYDPEATWTIKGNELILEAGVITIDVTAPGNLHTTYYLKFDYDEAESIEELISYTGKYREFIAPVTGTYLFELWGAQGGKNKYQGTYNYAYDGGKGGYTSGLLKMNKDEVVYIYVGGKGSNGNGISAGGWNGGGNGDYDHSDDEAAGAGGGATDVRLVPTSGETVWNEDESLKSRIMVAGAGGGASDVFYGASAGGLVGYNGGHSTGGKQTTYGYNTVVSDRTAGFGYGESGVYTYSNLDEGGGGSGYYGGGAGSASNNYNNPGAGGSSYISGHTGSVAIMSAVSLTPRYDSNMTKCEEGTTDNVCSIHYSGKYFTNTVMIDGSGYNWTTEKGEQVAMPNPNGGEYALGSGNAGNGAARITLALLSDNNYLESLEVSEGELDPEFNTIEREYTDSVSPYTYEVQVDGVPYHNKAVVNGFKTYHLNLGSNLIPITVTAEDGSIRTYTINVYRNYLDYPSSELMQYNIDDAINEVPQGETEFDLHILSGAYSVDVLGIPFDSDATVTYSGFGYIKTSKTCYITVTNPKANPSKTVYKINVIKGDISGSSEFDYTGSPQVFDVEYTGYYLIEAWGAQGGNAGGYAGGYGAYSTGIAKLNGGETLYVYVGGQGKSNVSQKIVYSDYNWTRCAGEGGTCNAPAGALIAYGERSTFVYRQLGDTQTSISCSNGVFGDPLGGVVKKCMYTTEPIKSNSGDNTGGFNGGGNANPSTTYAGAGGGASHVSTEAGLLSELSNKKGDYSEERLTYDSEDIIIVAGGGGGAGYSGTAAGGSGGGFKGNYRNNSGNGQGGTQTEGGNGNNAGSFGQGGSRKSGSGGAGGGGFFGGGASTGDYGAGGGSGFIGSQRLKSITGVPKHMTCYNCNTAEESEILTETTTRYSSNPTTDYAKSGNGYVKITVLNLSENNYLSFIDVDNIVDSDNPVDLAYYQAEEEDTPLKTYQFNLTVDPSVTNIRLNAKPEDSKAIIENIGDFAVPVGTTDFVILVTAENGDELTYTVTITREADTNRYPSDILITGFIKSLCSVNETYCNLYDSTNTNKVNFASDRDTYNITVPSRIKQLKWIVNKGNVNQLVKGDGITPLKSGITDVTIEIESEYCAYYYPELNQEESVEPEDPEQPVEPVTPVDRTDPKYANCFSTYTYHVERIVSDDADLEELFIDNANTTGDFTVLDEDKDVEFDLNYTDPDVFDYFFSVPNSWDHIKYLVATPDAYDDGARANIIGNENFEVGKTNLVTIEVTAPDKVTKRNYRLHVYRELSKDIYITNFNTNGFTINPTFNKSNFGEYTITLPNDYDSITLNYDVVANTTNAAFTRTRATSISESRSGNTYTTTISNIPTGNTYYELNTVAENESYTGTYKFVINRIKNADSRLDSITAKVGDVTQTLAPVFNSDVYDYTVTLDPGVTSVDLSATVKVDTSTYRLPDNNKIYTGNNKKRIIVTAEDGSYSIYNINFVRPAFSDASLKAINIIGNDTNSYVVKTEDDNDFSPEVTSYKVVVPNEVYSIQLEGIKNNMYASVYGNGTKYLQTGLNDFTLSVTAENGAVRYYYLTVQREANSNLSLSNIYLRYNDTNYEFTVNDLDYSITIPYNIDYVDVNYSFSANTTSSTFTKSDLTTISNKNIKMSTGLNSYKINAKAENSSECTYNILITREISTINTIDSILLKEARVTKQSDNDYSAKLPFDIREVNFKITLSDDAASYSISSNDTDLTINGDNVKNLKLGDNVLLVTVLAEDNTPNIYTVTIKVLESGSASNYLSLIKVDKGELSPSYVKTINHYDVDVPYDATNITVSVIPEVSDEVSNISGMGKYNLEVGENEIYVVVESIDGVERTYNLTINRNASTDSSLSNLEISNTILNPGFKKDIYEYSIDVDSNSIPFSVITPTFNSSTYVIKNNEGLDTIGNTYDVEIEVTAPNGINKSTYVIHAKRVTSSNAYLDSLSVQDFEISPVFDPFKTIYTLTVPNSISSVLVNAIAQNDMATVTGKGTQNLLTGDNFVNVIVTAEDTVTVKKYTICITRELSSNTDLDSLEILNGELKQEYDYSRNTYDVDVYSDQDHLDFKIVLSDINSSYVIRNNNLESNSIVYVDINSESGTTRLLTFNVNLKPVVSALLKSITIDNYWLDQEFNSNIFDYTLTINYEDDTLDISYVKVDSNATVVETIPESFEVGENIISYFITDSEGINSNTYTIKVTRNPYVDNFLEYLYHDYGNGEFNEDFNKLKYNYTLDVDKSCDEITFFGAGVTSKATITVSTSNERGSLENLTDKIGSYKLNKGENIFVFNVTLNGYTRKYKVLVTRELDNEKDLLSLLVRNGLNVYDLEPEFSSNHLSYTTTVDEDVNSVTFTGTVSSTASVNGLGKHNLEPGNNTFTITVTAENGTTKIYTITVVKPASNNAELIDIVPSSGSLSPAFGYGNYEYDLELDGSVSTLYFSVVTEDSNAVVTGANEAIVPDGESTRTITVTAEDRESTQEYTIHVIKIISNDATLIDLKVKNNLFIDPNHTEENVLFSGDNDEYYVILESTKKTINSSDIIATTTDDGASIIYSSEITVNKDDYTEFVVSVLAEDKVTKKDYKIFFKRHPGTSSKIKDVKPTRGYLETSFSDYSDDYVWVVPKGIVNSIDELGIILEDEDATIQESLENGIYTITVTSEDGSSTSTYTFTIKKDGSNNFYLETLEVKDNSNVVFAFDPEFDEEINDYTVHVYTNTKKITISGTAKAEELGVLIFDNKDASITKLSTGTFNVSSDEENYVVQILDEDSNPVNEYHIQVVRDILTDKNLSDLYLIDENEVCNGSLCKIKPNFKPLITTYKVDVPNSYDSLNLGYTTTNEQQTVKFKIGTEYVENGYALKAGANVVSVEVYDGANVLTKTYILTINRSKNGNTNLASLVISSDLEGTYELTPEFDPNTLEYDIAIDPTLTEVDINVTTEDSEATTIINGYSYLQQGMNDATIIVLAADRKTEKTYIVHIFVGDPTKTSYLNNISVSSGKFFDLNPNFKKTTLGYVVTTDSSTESVMIEATYDTSKNIKVVGEGEYYISTGVNVFTLTSTLYEDDNTTVISSTVYTISVVRPISSNVYLTDLKVTSSEETELLNNQGFYNLSKPFDRGTTEYGLTVSPGISTLDIRYSLDDNSSRVVIYGNRLTTGTNFVDVVVFNADETLTKTYQITVEVLPSEDSSLTAIKLYDTFTDEFGNDEEVIYGVSSEDFEEAEDNTYTVNVSYDVEKVILEGTAKMSRSTVIGNGTYYLDYGNNVLLLNVEAEDGEHFSVYTINVYRAYNLYLSDLKVDDTSVTDFDKTNENYTMEVNNDVKTLIIEGIPEENNVEVSYSLDTGSATGGEIIDGKLYTGVGVNKVLVTVKAPDDKMKIYHLDITRKQSDNNYLEALDFNEGNLNEVFVKTDNSYTMYILDTYTSISYDNKKDILTEDPAASYIVEGLTNLSKEHDNTVTITVTSESGKTNVYTVTVMLKPEEWFRHYLQKLELSYKSVGMNNEEVTNYAALSPAFVKETKAYTATVPYSVSSITVNTQTYIPDDEALIKASTEPNTSSIADGTYSLNLGRNVINVRVYSTLPNNDGSFSIYKVIVYRQNNPDAALANLSVEGFLLSPSFSSNVLNYEVSIDTSSDKLNITPVPRDPGAIIEIIGNKDLHEGDNVITIRVTAADGSTKRDYKITAHSTLSDNNYLRSLSVKDYDIDPGFTKTNTGIYLINVNETVSNVYITAIKEVSDSSLKTVTNTSEFVNKESISMNLEPGNNFVYLTVTSAAGNSRTYTLNVFKAYSSDNKLKNLVISDGELEPEFDPEITSYTVTLEDDLEKLSNVSVIGFKNHTASTIQGNGSHTLKATGSTEVVITVTSQSGDKKEYKVTFVKKEAPSCKLLALNVYEGELVPDFTSDGTIYYVTVPNEITSLDLEVDKNVIPEDENATIEITGNSDFKVGMNPVVIKVTSTKGVERSYQIYVTRSILASNYLSDLYVIGYDFVPEFKKDIIYYELSVVSSVDSVTLNAVLEDSSSKISIDGVEDITSKDLSLNYGDNKCYVTVTSATGSSRTYTVNVIRVNSSEYYLLTLTSNVGTWDKVFDTDTKEYAITLDNANDTITFSGTYSQGAYANGLGTFDVPVGESTHTIVITSESGQTNTYTINLNRPPKTETGIEFITSNRGELEYNEGVYSIVVADSSSTIRFDVTTVDPNATVVMDEVYRLDYRLNTIEIEVVAQDGVTKQKYTIKVYRNKDLASINIIEDVITLDVGEEADILYVLDPEDTNDKDVTWSILDPTIATINDGHITSLKEGITHVYLKSQTNPLIYDRVEINVSSKRITSSVYDIWHTDDEPNDLAEVDFSYIIGINDKTSLDKVISSLDNSPENIKVYSGNTKFNNYRDYAGTGMVIKLEINGIVYDEVVIIVRGDNGTIEKPGNGIITSTDYAALSSILAGLTLKTQIISLLYDLNKNKILTVTDLSPMSLYIAGKATFSNLNGLS